MAKDTFYFSHDFNARSDEKIKKMIRKHGMIAYGVFWAIVEDLYNNANALQTDYDGISYDLRVDAEIVESVINDFNLFVVSGDTFSSNSVQARLDYRKNKSIKARKSALKRWDDANAMQSQCEGNAIKEIKGKEIKGKERIKKDKKEFVAPLLEDVKKYFAEKGYKEEAAIRAYEYYDTGDWKDSNGNKVKNWKQKMIAVWFKPENSIVNRSKYPDWPDGYPMTDQNVYYFKHNKKELMQK